MFGGIYFGQVPIAAVAAAVVATAPVSHPGDGRRAQPYSQRAYERDRAYAEERLIADEEELVQVIAIIAGKL